MPTLRARVTALLAGVALLVPGYAGTAAADPPDLDTTVSSRLLEASRSTRPDLTGIADARHTRITVTDRADGWAFGKAILTTPRGGEALPEGRLFLARQEAGQWHVTLDGETEFADLAATAPVLSQPERTAFNPDDVSIMADPRTQMRLPFAIGQTWYLTGGPHGWSGSAAPWSSIDLAGGDQRVLATRAGTAYTMCTGWIRVIHGGGYATDYYHLWSSINVNGASVGEGAYLGYTGTDVTCGGSASGRHVHMGLRHNGAYTTLHGSNLGKWVFLNGGSAYSGSALHGSRQVPVGGAVYNYGPLWWGQAIIDAFGAGGVNKRSGPGTGYGVVGGASDGDTVTISCSAYGTSHTGRWGTSALWNRLSDGSWVSDAYMWTGSNGPVNGWC